MKKKMSLLLILMLILGLTSINFATTPGEALQKTKIIQGDGTGLGEENPLSREEMVTILSRLNVENGFENFNYSGNSGFTDVPNDHWAAPYVAFAKSNGITNGIGEGKFGLGENITGRQAIIFFARALGVEDTSEYYTLKPHELSYQLKSEENITLDKLDRGKYDKNIKRSDVFSLMVEALNHKHKKTEKSLKDSLNIELPKLEEINFVDYYDYDFKKIILTEKEKKHEHAEYLIKARDISNNDSNNLKEKVEIWKNATNIETVSKETILNIINSNYEVVGLSTTYESHGLISRYRDGEREAIKDHISFSFENLLTEGKTRYEVQGSEGMSGGDLKYIRTDKVDENYYIFVEDTIWQPGTIHLIVLDNTGETLKYYADTPYGVGSNTLE